MNRRFTKAAAGLAAAALAAGLSMSATGAAHADPIVPTTWAEIYNPYLNAAGNTLCVDDPSGSTAQFQKLQLWRCHGYASNGSPQRWVFTYVGNDAVGAYGTYQIRNTGSGWCIGVSPSVPNSQLEGTDLIQESCADTAHTEWDIAPPNRADSTSPFELELAPGPTTSAGWCFSASTFLDTNGTRLVAVGGRPPGEPMGVLADGETAAGAARTPPGGPATASRPRRVRRVKEVCSV